MEPVDGAGITGGRVCGHNVYDEQRREAECALPGRDGLERNPRPGAACGGWKEERVGFQPGRVAAGLGIKVGQSLDGVACARLAWLCPVERYGEVVVGKVGGLGGHFHRPRLAVGHGHLPGIPRSAEVCEIDYPHVGTDALHFACVPQRERVVVAVDEYDGVRLEKGERVESHVAGDVASAAVVVAPVGAKHPRRHGETQRADCSRCDWAALASGFTERVTHHCVCPGSYPYREGEERADIGIVAFACLAGGLVHVDDDHHACHDEQRTDDCRRPAPFPA